MNACIYTLKCPKTSRILYVGLTSVSLNIRLSQHMHSSKVCNQNIYKYIRQFNIVPIIKDIEFTTNTPPKNTLTIETFWIEQFRQWGFSPYNKVNNISITNDLEYVEDVEELYTTVKIKKKVMNKVRLYVSKSGESISSFFKTVADDKLAKDTAAYQSAMTTYLMQSSNKKRNK